MDSRIKIELKVTAPDKKPIIKIMEIFHYLLKSDIPFSEVELMVNGKEWATPESAKEYSWEEAKFIQEIVGTLANYVKTTNG